MLIGIYIDLLILLTSVFPNNKLFATEDPRKINPYENFPLGIAKQGEAEGRGMDSPRFINNAGGNFVNRGVFVLRLGGWRD